MGSKKSFSPHARSIEVKMHEGAKVEAPLSRQPSKGEISAKLPPCLAWCQDDRRLGVGTKSEQPPGAENEQKMEPGTDSITTEKGDHPNLQKRKRPKGMGINK